MSEFAADLARARDALDAAGEVLLRHAAAGVAREQKAGGGLVTAADREVDALLHRLLPLPGDGWLSEEREDDAARLGRRRVWVVDPLDGTREFVAGRPEYAVSIALLCDGQPVLGAVGNPARGVQVFGGPGLGTVLHGDPALAWSAANGRPRVLASRSEQRRGEWQRWQDQAHLVPLGSIAYQLALVAAGVADMTWTLWPKHEWDVAAGAALVLGAGGDVWLPRGGHLRWNRSRPRFLSFAAARAGERERAAALLVSRP